MAELIRWKDSDGVTHSVDLDNGYPRTECEMKVALNLSKIDRRDVVTCFRCLAFEQYRASKFDNAGGYAFYA